MGAVSFGLQGRKKPPWFGSLPAANDKVPRHLIDKESIRHILDRWDAPMVENERLR